MFRFDQHRSTVQVIQWYWWGNDIAYVDTAEWEWLLD